MTKPTTRTRHTFIEFMAREGWTREQSAFEYDEFLTINGHARLADSYATVRRTGATRTLTRAERANVHLTFANARNHADLAVAA